MYPLKKLSFSRKLSFIDKSDLLVYNEVVT